jgi:predicted nucleic acid-binding protein
LNPPIYDLIKRASEIRAEYPVSYADCFAVATALVFSASIITGDPEFAKVERLVRVELI